MGPRYIASTKLASAMVAMVFAIQVYQAATRPIASGEARIYDRFVRPAIRQVLAQELPNGDVLYSLLEKRSVGLFHVSPFSVRLPAVLFAILYLWSVWRVARLFFGLGRAFLTSVALASLIPLQWDCFSRADGIGLALSLQACAVWLIIEYLMNNQSNRMYNLNLAGACLGLSVAARLEFAIPAAAVGIVSLVALARNRQLAVWSDRVLIPAAVLALIFLVLPLSHAHAAPEITAEFTAGAAGRLQSALAVLRSRAKSDRIRIGASRRIEPVVNFYRAQHRINTWDLAVRDLSAGPFDYYLLTKEDTGWVERRQLIVLYRDADFVLARRSNDPM